MYQSWQKLLFLHWEMDADEIQSKLPEGLFVDRFENRAFIGVVPFYMSNIRPRFLPAVPGISHFLEMNVRTYVHDENGVPGVWFFSLDTNQPMAAFFGRTFFHMPYTHAQMSAEEKENGEICYHCRRKGSPATETVHFTYRGISAPAPAVPGSIEFFLAERYLLFAQNPKTNSLYSGRVHHSPYPLQEAEVSEFSNIPIKQAGFLNIDDAPVHSAYTDGVDVIAYALEKLP